MISCGEILSIIIIIIVLSHKQTIKGGDDKEPSLVMGIFTGHISEASASLPQSPAQTKGNERGMRLVRVDGFATFFCTPVDV